MKDWRDYPGRAHSVAELKRWANELKYFRYCPGHGGHANDGDRFVAKVAFQGSHDLLTIFNKLNLVLKKVSIFDKLKTVFNKTRLNEPSSISSLPRFQQPCFQVINEVTVFIWVTDAAFRIEIAGVPSNPNEVTDTNFENAQQVEKMLETIHQKIIIPPIDDPQCVSEKYYPELWE